MVLVMCKEKEYILFEFSKGYKVIKISVLGDYASKNPVIMKKNSEAMFRRLFPEKSYIKIDKISFLDENNLLKKISNYRKENINYFN
jgi:hypothetical protein